MRIHRSQLAHILCPHDKQRDRCGECRAALPAPTFGTYADHCTLIFPVTLPGLNEILRVKASRWKGRWNKLKVKWQEVVARCWNSAGRPKFKSPVKLTWRFFEPTKRRDPSNVAAAAEKIVLDGLVNAGCLPGDGWNWIAPPNTQHWAVDRTNPRIELSIELVSGEF